MRNDERIISRFTYPGSSQLTLRIITSETIRGPIDGYLAQASRTEQMLLLSVPSGKLDKDSLTSMAVLVLHQTIYDLISAPTLGADADIQDGIGAGIAEHTDTSIVH